MRPAVALLAWVLASCTPAPAPDPVLVFAAGDNNGPLAALLDEFADDTGTPVDIRWGGSAELADALVSKTGDPADVLITNDVADIWRAGDRGALRPLASAAFRSQPASLKDPDGYWAALTAYPITVVRHDDASPQSVSLDDLGEPGFAGRLCLSTSALAVSRSLLGFLIEQRGAKETERLVRRWVRNLGRHPTASEAALLDAVASGACEYGVASLGSEIRGATAVPVEPRLVTVTAMGVGRHAANPEGGAQLVDWLLRSEVASSAAAAAAGAVPVHIAGWRDEEARLLAERAGYR